ncbi:MAG: lysostaphin resistance A-like protein [Sarcina sp.]
MKFNLNPFKIYSDIENGNTYIRPLNIFFAILVIIIDILLVTLIESQVLKILKTFNANSEFIFNTILFLIQLFTALLSLNIVLLLVKRKTPDINYASNSYTSDFIYVIFLIFGFRFLYEGTIYQLKNLLYIDFTVNSILLSCIYAPFIEELMYRGIILNGMLKKYPETVALIVSSTIFGIMHFSLFQSINAFLIGLLIGYLFIKTKSIYLCIFIHFCNNFIVMYLPVIFFDSTIMHILYAIFNIILGTCLLLLTLRKMNLHKRKKIFSDYDEEFNFFVEE